VFGKRPIDISSTAGKEGSLIIIVRNKYKEWVNGEEKTSNDVTGFI